MFNKKIRPPHLSPAYWTTMVSLAAAVSLLAVDWHFSLIVLALYGLIFSAAPFMPRFGFFLPVISRGNTNRKAVALTFDDGPDPLATPALLKLLEQRRLRATFFVTGSKAARYPHLVRAIVRNGHTIGNHSYHHNPLLYFKGAKAVRREIEATQEVLRPFGIMPLLYRPPVGILSPVLRKPLHGAGLRVVNFSCRAFDLGNKRVKGLAFRILKRVQADDIILLHDTMPRGETHLQIWLNEMEALFVGLGAMGLAVVPLEKLIGRPVMAYRPAK